MNANNIRPTLSFLTIVSLLVGCATTDQHPGDQRLQSACTELTNPLDARDSRTPTEGQHRSTLPGGSSVISVGYQSDADVEELTSAPEELTAPAPASPTSRAAADGLTLETLEQLALQNNPSLRQATAGVSKAAGIRTQVGLAPNPSVGYFGDELGNGRAAGLHGAFLSQTFVRGDKLAWNRDVLGFELQSSRWQVEAQRVRVRNDVRLQFYAALGALRRLELSRQFRAVAEQGVEISRELVSVKEGALPDILQSEVQLSEVDLAIQQAEYEFVAARNELVAMVGIPELGGRALLGDLATPTADREMEATYARIIAESPLLAVASAQVRRARANMRRQRVQPTPNLNAQVGAGYDDSSGDEFANVQLTLPLPVHNRNQGNIRAADAAYREAIQNVNRIRMRIRRDLARAMRDFQVARATVSQYETLILPKVGETLKLMQTAQEAGEFDFLRVLTARRAYFDANLRYVTALTDLAQANTRIDGLLLTGGLDQVISFDGTDELRGAALSTQ